MAYKVHVGYDAMTDELYVYVSERVLDRVYYLEPSGEDGLVRQQELTKDTKPKPLWKFSHFIAAEIMQSLVEELAKHGYRAADPRDGSMPIALDALADAKAVRDRLLAIVEKR